MTYDQLLTLDSIVKEGSFKAASEKLFKSQPSLSVAIKKLEEELGIELFDRSEYRPKLTEKGKAFYAKSIVALEHFDSLYNFGKELALGHEGEIRISIDAVFPIAQLKETFLEFFAPHITTTLSLSIDVLEGAMEKVMQQKVDFAISTYFVESSEIESIKLLEISMVPCIAKEALINRTLDEAIEKLPQIIVKSSTQNPSKNMFGLHPTARKWFTSDMSMKIELIKNGLGWGRIPSHLVAEELRTKKLVEINQVYSVHPIKIPLYLLRNKKQLMGPNTKHLWNYLKEKFN